jgi:type 1 fimbria pilin
MSIASEITRLQSVKSDILQAISDKGVSIPSSAKLADCPGLIAGITSSGGKIGVKETAEVIITPNVKADGGLQLTSEGAAHITEKTGLSFEVPFVQLKQEPWNNTSEKVGLSFEISYLSLTEEV